MRGSWPMLVGLLLFALPRLSACGDDDDPVDPGRGVWEWDAIDNEAILFFSRRADPSGFGEIYLLTKDGVITQKVDNQSQNYNPSLAPDGRGIAFHRWMNPSVFSSIELFHLDVDTGAETRLTTDAFAGVAPKWSPDGATLVFAAWTQYGEPSEANLLTLELATWSEAHLTADPDHEDNDPSWCGADAIAFKSTRNTEMPAKEEIYVVGADGRGVTRLSTVDDWQSGGWESDHDPRCSPDGQWIYFYRFEATRPWTEFTAHNWDEIYPANIWRVDRSGNQEQLTFSEHACSYPIPSKDGTSVGFLEKVFIVDGSNNLIGSTARLMVMDPDGSNPRELLPPTVLGEHRATLEYWDW